MLKIFIEKLNNHINWFAGLLGSQHWPFSLVLLFSQSSGFSLGYIISFILVSHVGGTHVSSLNVKQKAKRRLLLFLALHLTPPADPTQSIPPIYNIAPLWDGVLFIWKVFLQNYFLTKRLTGFSFFWLSCQTLKLWGNFRPKVPNPIKCGLFLNKVVDQLNSSRHENK